MNKKLGQISIPIALVLTGMAGVTTGLSSYYASQLSQNARSAKIEQDVAVLQTQKLNIENNFNDLKTKIDKIGDKVDTLLINRGIDPKNIKK